MSGNEQTKRGARASALAVVAAPLVAAALLLGGCASAPPTNPDNLCSVFQERPRWHRAARDAERRWGAPIAVMMAVMFKESSYRHNAKPPRKKFMGIPRIARESSAYGFAQATDPAWRDYLRGTGNRGAKRDKFADAVDFVGWYIATAHRRAGISKVDARAQYLAYYSGIGGYQRGVWRNNAWLKDAAARVARRSDLYARQLGDCAGRL